MQTKMHRFAILAVISFAGVLLLIGGTQAGASTLTAPTPTPPQPAANVDDIAHDAMAPADGPIQRIQTVSLLPFLDDVVSAKWPVRVDDLIYNRPGLGSFKLPDDACMDYLAELSWGLDLGRQVTQLRCHVLTGDGYFTFIDILTTTPQAWITVTYKTRERAVRYREMITVTAIAATNQAEPYDPLISTIVYTRHYPNNRSDYWGGTFLSLTAQSPAPAEQSLEDAWVKWVTMTKSFTGTVVVREPLFGSDLTVTQLTISTFTPTVGVPTYFTAVIKNVGVMTAFRWFPVELYVRPASAPPPDGIDDHEGGVDMYGNFAFLKPLGNSPESDAWKIPELGVGMSLTLQTAITFMTELGNLRIYAQPDVYFDGDRDHYSIYYGSNPRGYGELPEGGVMPITQTIFVPIGYRVDASPRALTWTIPPGQQRSRTVQVLNVGNMTDTYTVTIAPSQPTWTVTLSPSPQVLPGARRPLTVTVRVPPGTAENTVNTITLTIQSHGEPTRTVQSMLYAIARKEYLYLPLIRKQ